MRRSGYMLAGLIAVAVLFGGFWWYRTTAEQRERTARYQTAIQRWAARGFVAYRMVIEQGNCTTDYEVRNERVVWGHETPCGRGQARSVTNLFEQIVYGQERVACVGSGCVCEQHTTVDVQYDPQLGYPNLITLRTQLVPNWRERRFWELVLKNRELPCAMSVSEHRLVVQALIPHANSSQ